MEGFLYDIEKSIDFFQEEDYFSTGDRSILKEELNISLFETNNDKEDKKRNLGEKKKKNKRTYNSIKEKEINKRRKEKFLAKSEEEKKIQRKKNAISAKKFRMKKKEEFNFLLKQNEDLKKEIEFLNKKIFSLEDIISNYKLLSPKIFNIDLN